MGRPTGRYAEQMLNPGGWPGADEDVFYDRGRQFTQVLRDVTDVLEAGRHHRSEIFEGGLWSGAAANVANTKLGKNIDQLVNLQSDLINVITWHNYVAGMIEQAKSAITDNTEAAQLQIAVWENDPTLDADERNAAIDSAVSTTRGANVGVVTGTGEQILASKTWKPPSDALEHLLEQQTPPPETLSDLADQAPEGLATTFSGGRTAVDAGQGTSNPVGVAPEVGAAPAVGAAPEFAGTAGVVGGPIAMGAVQGVQGATGSLVGGGGPMSAATAGGGSPARPAAQQAQLAGESTAGASSDSGDDGASAGDRTSESVPTPVEAGASAGQSQAGPSAAAV